MALKTPLKREVTPYEISQYLKEVYKVEHEPQRVYRARKDGRLAAHLVEVGNGTKWYVTIEDATKYIEGVLNGSVKKEKAW